MSWSGEGYEHVRVECPWCGVWFIASWPPGDTARKYVGHGDCRSFQIGLKEAAVAAIGEPALGARGYGKAKK